MKLRKKLIEVALPLDAINEASVREKSIRHGHPSTLHLWWARRPLAAARAVIFAQMVDDPGSWPELFPTVEAQQQERERIFDVIRELVQWENTTNERVLTKAREEIWKSWRRTCTENQDHPRAKDLFNPEKLPAFHDPFAGGGSLPLEAQRLGLEAYASDLNPVAVLINKAMIEIPPRVSGHPPANPESQQQAAQLGKVWTGAQGLAEDVRYYGKWIRAEAEKRIGHLYPKVEITAHMAKKRPDLKPLVGQKLTVIAWLWARTVKSPNPAFAKVNVPLVSNFMLSTRPGKEAYVDPVIETGSYRFAVHVGKPDDVETAKSGTKLARGANFRCVMSGTPISGDYIKGEGKSGRMSVRLLAVIAEGDRERVYLDPTEEMEVLAQSAKPSWKPDMQLATEPRALWTPAYGLSNYGDLFTNRQLAALATFSDLIGEVRANITRDLKYHRTQGIECRLAKTDTGGLVYSDAIAIYLAFTLDRVVDRHSSIATWDSSPSKLQLRNTFARQGIPMTWDFGEGNPFCESSGAWSPSIEWVARAITALPAMPAGEAVQADAATQGLSKDRMVSTDPPYYDNIGYADLSDFFYIWLRRSLQQTLPDLFSTLAVPRIQELIASPYRHGSKEHAETFFLEGMTHAIQRLAGCSHPAFPVTIYYAFKQAERETALGTSSTGWETFLDAVIRSGFGITGTWPVRTELGNRPISMGSNALASSIVLVCRSRGVSAPIGTRREFVGALKTGLPAALLHLQHGNVAPVDLAQAAIGPGMAIYTRYSKVVDAEGKIVPVREALGLINQTLDEVLAEQEGNFDSDTRWALAWFEQSGFSEGKYGVAETLSKAKNTSVSGLESAGILKSKAGKVRLLRPEELPLKWDPQTDARLTVWEVVHHLVRRLEKDGESGAAELVAILGGMAETARELAYRLYAICERKKRAQEALSYNALVQSWPEIVHLAREDVKAQPEQTAMFS